MVDEIYRKDILKGVAFKNDLIICEDVLFQWYLFKKVKRLGFIPMYKLCINMMKHNYILLNRFKCYQKIVRKNIIKILKAKGISKKHELGWCFLVLPYIFL